MGRVVQLTQYEYGEGSFAHLINEVSGKENNPYVFVYEFILIEN